MKCTRKKLLLREDEAELIEFALAELMKRFEQTKKEYSAMESFAFSAVGVACYGRAAEKARGIIAEIGRILKLVQDAEVTETVVEA